MSKTIKTAGVVFLISFIPIGILGLITWNGTETLVPLLHIFILMIGFMGVPIYFLTLLYEFLIARNEKGPNRHSKYSLVIVHWRFTITVNLLIFAGVIYALIDSSNLSFPEIIFGILNAYTQEYLVVNLLVTIVTILIPTIHHRNKGK